MGFATPLTPGLNRRCAFLENYAQGASVKADAEKPEEEYIVDVRNLVVHYETPDGIVEAVNGVDLKIAKGETVGLVGETGAGKTTIALSIMGLLPVPPSNIISGEILVDGEDVRKKSEREMRDIRGSTVSMIFQDPMTALSPTMKIVDQIAEVIKLHRGVSKKEASEAALEVLKTVGIPPERGYDYPHQFSGGMKQRVVIAIALACRPKIVIADEPTTALDVTIQAQILDLLRNLKSELNTSVLLITHDFGIVAETCDRCVVIYAGEIVESGTVKQVFENPCHPFTTGLFASLPKIGENVRRLNPIKGLMINPMDLPSHCSFYERCDLRSEQCNEADPRLFEVESGHMVKCFQQKVGEEVFE